MTPEDINTVLVAAGAAGEVEDWPTVDRLLSGVYSSQVLSGTDHGDAACLLGLAALAAHDWPNATTLLIDAAATASERYQVLALERIDDLARRTDALEAERHESTNAHAVLTAANDALARHDPVEARTHYGHLLEGFGDPKARARGLIGMARVLVLEGDLVESSVYAQHALATGLIDDEAHAFITWLKQQNDAANARNGGVSAAEYPAVLAAGETAVAAGRWREARRDFDAIYRSVEITGPERAAAALRAGQMALHERDHHSAEQYFDFAHSYGEAPIRSAAAHQQALLSLREAAAESAGPSGR